MHCRRQFRLGARIQKILTNPKVIMSKGFGLLFGDIPIIFKRRPSKTAFCNRSKPPPEYWHTQRKQSQPQQGETPWGKCAPLPKDFNIAAVKTATASWSWFPKELEVEQKKTWQKSDASNDLPQIGGVNKENLADTSEANSRTPKHIIDGWIKCTRQPTTSFYLRLWTFPSYSWFKNQTTLRIEFHFKRNNKKCYISKLLEFQTSFRAHQP